MYNGAPNKCTRCCRKSAGKNSSRLMLLIEVEENMVGHSCMPRVQFDQKLLNASLILCALNWNPLEMIFCFEIWNLVWILYSSNLFIIRCSGLKIDVLWFTVPAWDAQFLENFLFFSPFYSFSSIRSLSQRIWFDVAEIAELRIFDMHKTANQMLSTEGEE